MMKVETLTILITPSDVTSPLVDTNSLVAHVV